MAAAVRDARTGALHAPPCTEVAACASSCSATRWCPTGTTATRTSCAASRASCSRAATTSASTSRATPGAAQNLVAEHGDGAARRRSAPPIPQLAAAATTLATLDLDARARRRRPGARARVERPRAGRAHRRAPRARRRLPPALPRHAPPRGHRRRERWPRYDLRHYDGVLAFGAVIRDLYLERGWAQRAWTWHEAADTRVFRPLPACRASGDLVWIGNWGDDERTAELHEFLLEPVARARAAGARPRRALSRRRAARARRRRHRATRGWLPNYRVPAVFARHRGDGARAAPALRRGAARHPDDPRVRGAGLRHPAGLRAVGRRRGAVHARRGLPRRARRRGDAATPARRCSHDPSWRRELAAARPADDPRAPHLRAPRRRAARDRAELGVDGAGGATAA